MTWIDYVLIGGGCFSIETDPLEYSSKVVSGTVGYLGESYGVDEVRRRHTEFGSGGRPQGSLSGDGELTNTKRPSL